MKLKTIQVPDKIVSKISAPLPEYVIQERDAGRGQTLSYISGATVIDILNTTFGHLGWSFDIIKEWKEESTPFFNKYSKDTANKVKHNGQDGAWENQGPVAWVHGKLTVYVEREDGTFHTISKEAFGSKSVIGKQSEQEHIFKSAQTDALKKAASLLGIGAELYRGEEEQAYYNVISKPIIWDEEHCNNSEVWQKLFSLASEYSWNTSDINYYVSEYTEGSYTNIYTLPEAYFEGLIEYINTALEEE